MRHIGPSESDIEEMLGSLGYRSLEELIDAAVPEAIRLRRPLALGEGVNEREMLARLREIAAKNKLLRSYIGMGYHGTYTPPVIQRNILENPGWYTAYTPYQAEISQGRLEALLVYQTMVADLTGLEIANASMLDEATAAAEAMVMSYGAKGSDDRRVFFVSEACHPQVIDVVLTRGRARDYEIVVGDHRTFEFGPQVFGALVAYPTTDGAVEDYREFCERAHAAGALVTVAADLLSLVSLVPPGEWGADIAVGNTQRFGVPMGYGGPHAAFFATKEEYRRHMPGRIIGVSKDSQGRPALRMALQTREQHIRREKATSNICTSQVLLAVMAGMYAVWHGPDGLRAIAERVHSMATVLAAGLEKLGHRIAHRTYFDTLRVELGRGTADEVLAAALARGINLRKLGEHTVGVALDETVGFADVADLFEAFALGRTVDFAPADLARDVDATVPEKYRRTSDFLTHPVFHRFRSETEMMRYLHRLESRDLALNTAMIPLGSCTMKLNAAAEMYPITWPEFTQLHPFVPRDQAEGYRILMEELGGALAEITGMAAVSFMPNAGSQGEFTGLMTIRRYHDSRGESGRRVCLIPQSAHGTNPASAVMAGLEVVVVKSDEHGNIDIPDLKAKAEQYRDRLAALMVTYPSTHGIFEEGIKEICRIVHENGGQVYLDGANMNAMVGVARPGDIGADVCHLNLHKTFAIPHGGGGPGMGPIAVAAHLVPMLPSHPVVPDVGGKGMGAVSAAPFGSPDILPISWAYIQMLGAPGLLRATQVAILNANYVAKRLAPHYPVLYRGRNDLIAHECIIDPRGLKAASGVEAIDIAKRLMDYGFHAPTVSFPVHGTLMIEPTESESKEELDRFCDALIAIRAEIARVERGELPKDDNPVHNSPHTAGMVASSTWDHPYTREEAAFPTEWTRESKFWPYVGRIEDAWGDRNLVAVCPPAGGQPCQ